MPLHPRPPVWRPEYVSGNEEMDREHQELFGELSGFLTLFWHREPQAHLTIAFDALVNKCAAHFRSEEALLRSVGYPDADRHAAVHAQLLSKCEQLRSSFGASPKELVELMTGRLFETIVAHIVSADLAFYPWLNAAHQP
jgi:hemerythrin-like metal-binding protein